VSEQAAKYLAKGLVVATALGGAIALAITGHSNLAGWMIFAAILLW
jgi:hypothetical protein